VIAETQATPGGPRQRSSAPTKAPPSSLDPADDALVAIWQQNLGALAYCVTAG
jgi:hypothetical protein